MKHPDSLTAQSLLLPGQRWLAWSLLAPLALVLLFLCLMAWQSASDYFDLRHKAAIRVSDQASSSAARLEEVLHLLDMVSAQAARQQGEPDWPGSAASRLGRLQREYMRALPGLGIGVYEAGDAFRANDPTQFAAYGQNLQAQRQRLAQAQTGVALDFLPLAPESGIFLLTQAFREPAGKTILYTHLLLPLHVLRDILDDLHEDAHSATLLTLGQERRKVLRLPRTAAFATGAPVPLQAGVPFGGVADVMRVAHGLDGMDRIAARRDIPVALAHTSLQLAYSTDWNAYLAGWYRSAAINLLIALLAMAGYLAYCRAVLRTARGTQALRQSAAQMQALLERLPLAVLKADAAGRILYSNPAMIEQFGAPAAQGQPLATLFPAEADWRAACAGNPQPQPMISRQGLRYMLIQRTDLGTDMLLNLVDATDSHLHQQRLQTEASVDPLTGLANRRCFDAEAARLVADGASSGQPLYVLALDLDHFKRVNDQHGHDIGDVVLRQAAAILKSCLRGNDLAARMGGEEFCALLPGASADTAALVAERIRAAIAASPVQLPGGGSLAVTTSIGLACLHPGAGAIEVALKAADLALYQAKETGRNRVASYTASE